MTEFSGDGRPIRPSIITKLFPDTQFAPGEEPIVLDRRIAGQSVVTTLKGDGREEEGVTRVALFDNVIAELQTKAISGFEIKDGKKIPLGISYNSDLVLRFTNLHPTEEFLSSPEIKNGIINVSVSPPTKLVVIAPPRIYSDDIDGQVDALEVVMNTAIHAGFPSKYLPARERLIENLVRMNQKGDGRFKAELLATRNNRLANQPQK